MARWTRPVPEPGRGVHIGNSGAWSLAATPVWGPPTDSIQRIRDRERRRKPQGRICANCPTILSIYNVHPICATCWSDANATNPRTCDYCSKALPWTATDRRKFCNPDCRKAAMRMRLHAS